MSTKPLRDWILDQPSVSKLLPPWDKCQARVEPLSSPWNKGSGGKVLGWDIDRDDKPEHRLILGGICSIYSAESESMRQGLLNFHSVKSFEEWIFSWYPRLDQIHDCVGIPPKNSAKIIYVCEDSFFARRISSNPGNECRCLFERENEIGQVLKEVHEKQGHPVLVNWLKQHGYSGPVEVVYTSELSKEIDLMLRLWRRKYNHGFSFADSFGVAVKMMYTPYWLDVLGYDCGIVYEPALHMKMEKGLYDHSVLSEIYQKIQTEFESGEMTFIGFLPFWSSRGQTRNLALDKVPNFGNWREFELPEGEEEWYAANTLFHQKRIINEGPASLSPEEVKRRLAFDLSVYYQMD